MVTRYKMYRDMQTECYCEMDEREDGGYVSIEDYDELLAKYEALFHAQREAVITS